MVVSGKDLISLVYVIPPLLSIATMADDIEPYLAVLKASYDYEPQSDDEIEIKEDQILLLVKKVDEEYVDAHHQLQHC